MNSKAEHRQPVMLRITMTRENGGGASGRQRGGGGRGEVVAAGGGGVEGGGQRDEEDPNIITRCPCPTTCKVFLKRW